ncbi:MAG TPA: MOSC domain-containing protein [Miltoncostaeaceae bacterium]|nr:MOSC domain-containing protein [Miltoncostaeaceae bacterium]
MIEQVLSVNVGGVRTIPNGTRTTRTGIFKEPADGRVPLGREGFTGDRQADRRVHGGPEMAAYLYSADDYRWWEDELGRPLPPGTFGENLTVTGLRDGEVHIGDRFRLGTALVEVTAPREPCFKLGLRMEDPRFVVRFRKAGRTGFYVRVLEEGDVGAGDPIERVERDAQGFTVLDAHRTMTGDRGDAAALRRAAGVVRLKSDWREHFARLAAGLSPDG